ncbi:MAG: hypothetical protein K940chlam7_00458 [Chlamydiae bacterium]|nr:hypothetical protein [Chlamydiota bacterium]
MISVLPCIKSYLASFWKLEDQGVNQTSYIRFKTGLFGSHYVDVNYENLSCVANNLNLESANLTASTSHETGRSSWGKSVAACVLGGLLLSAGRSWNQSSGQNSVSNAIVMLKGTLGPTVFKADFAFQMATIAAMSRQEGGVLPGALLAGMMLLPEPVKGQPFCPQLAGSYDTPRLARAIAVSGNYAYVGVYNYGYVADWFSLQIFAVSNVANPTLVGSYNTSGYIYDIAVSGNYVYVADNTYMVRTTDTLEFKIIDVSNVANPTLVGSYDTPGSAHGIAVSGNYAFVADYDVGGLQIIDVSNKTNLTLMGSYITPSYAIDVTVSGNYAYVAGVRSGLQIIDVSNVANPMLVGSYDTPGLAIEVAVSGNYAYVADTTFGLQIIDVSNVANPTFAGFYDTPGYATGIAISGNYAYVVCSYDRLLIIDVSNVANLLLVGSYEMPPIGKPLGVAVSGNYAFVADDYEGLQIIDVSLPCPTGSSSTTSSTTSTQSSHSFVPDGTPKNGSMLWFGLLGGGALCICFIGGTVLFLQERKKTSNHKASSIESRSESRSSLELEQESS